MSSLQTVCIFASGYLLSRLVLCARGHESFVAWVLRRAGGRMSGTVAGVMASAFALSTFIPNALTVLALIPVVGRLRAAFGVERRDVATILAMAVIYGANIGGLASLAGSPANLYMVVNLSLLQIPGRQALHFVSWLAFGLPMAGAFLVLCWVILMGTERPTMRLTLTEQGPLAAPATTPLLRAALRWARVWAAFWVGLIGVSLTAGLQQRVLWRPQVAGVEWPISTPDVVALAFTALLAVVLFAVPQAGQRRLLTPRDLVRELPLKGVLLGIGVLAALVILAQAGVVSWLGQRASVIVPQKTGPFVAALVLVLVTIFATEVFSNTAVATVLFPVSAAIAGRVGADPMMVMLSVSLASTCAFMTPVATPVNTLAIAGIGSVSLRTFAKNGALANVVGGVWITVWVTWIVPHVLRWFA